MRHEITTKEAEAIRRARAPRDIRGMSSLELEAEAACGNRQAAERLAELRHLDELESKAGTQ